MKKLTSIILVLVLVFSLLPVGVLAEEGENLEELAEEPAEESVEEIAEGTVEPADAPVEEPGEESGEDTDEELTEETAETEETLGAIDEAFIKTAEESTAQEEQAESEESTEDELSLDGATACPWKGSYFTSNVYLAAAIDKILSVYCPYNGKGTTFMSGTTYKDPSTGKTVTYTDGSTCYAYGNWCLYMITGKTKACYSIQNNGVAKSDSYTTQNRLAGMSASKFVSNYLPTLTPGTVIRLWDGNQNYWGHTIVFLGKYNNQYCFIDANWNSSNVGSNQVQYYTIPTNASYMRYGNTTTSRYITVWYYVEPNISAVRTDWYTSATYNSTVTITYNSNYLSGNNWTETVTKGGKITNLPTYSRPGYTFNGWYTAASGGTLVTTSTTFSSNTTLYAHWTADECAIEYNANGGTGAPETQYVPYESVATLSSVIPTRDGYTFLGWSEDSTATSPTYDSSGSCLVVGHVHLYAVWEKQEEEIDSPDAPWDEASAVIEIPSGTTQPGRTVVLTVTISKNIDGMSFLTLRPDYDKEHLTLTAVENGDIFDSMDVGNQIIFDNGSDTWKTGVLCRLTFETDADAPLGEYLVFPGIKDCYNEQEASVSVIEVGGCLVLNNISHGDANGDGSVDGRDVIRLRKYLANYDSMTGTSTVEISDGADANGDGSVDGRDVIRLRKYLANYDSTTGSSTVTLGPSN